MKKIVLGFLLIMLLPCIAFAEWNGGGGWSGTTSSGSGTPEGSNTQVQFNDGGAFGGDAGMTYNKTTDSLTLVGDITLDEVNFTWDGSTQDLATVIDQNLTDSGFQIVTADDGVSTAVALQAGISGVDLGVSADLTLGQLFLSTIQASELNMEGDLIVQGDTTVADLTANGVFMSKDVAISTVLSPSNVSINGAEPIVYVNNTGVTVTVTKLRAWADGYDDTVVVVNEVDADGVSNETQIDSLTCTDGSGPYTVEVTSGFDHATIESGHAIRLVLDGTDDPNSLTVLIELRW